MAVRLPPEPPLLPPSASSSLRTALTSAVSLMLSVLLHLGLAGPTLFWTMAHVDDVVLPGELEESSGPVGDGLIGEGGTLLEPLREPYEPVSVSLYVPPPPPAAAADAATGAAPPAEAVPVKAKSSSSSSSSRASSSAPGETREEYVARVEAAAAERKAALLAGKEENSGIQGRPPRGKRAPCDPLEEVVQTGPTSWTLERDIVDYYASHIKELDQQAVTKTMKDEENKPYGVRVYLPRCSVLRSGGLLNGDVVTSVNGKKVATLPQAIKTWLAVRNKSNIVVEITRKDGSQVVHNYKIAK